MAVLREYGTNAWDAHVEAGLKNKPIKITLPSRFLPTLRIRDFGPGIPEKNIFDVYCQYGNSTKRETNTAVGMLGIGCKSGFAYSDTFTIVSYHAGMKKTYVAFIDPTNLGKMTKLAETECGSETGVEIQIQTQANDVDAFRNKARSLFKYFNPRPEINCILPIREYTNTGTGWALRSKNNNDTDSGPIAIMGNIGYPIKPQRLDKLPENLKSLLNVNIDMLFPIGAVSIAASREDLEYTDKTLNAIRTTLEMCLRELEVNVKESLSKAKTLHEARSTFVKTAGKKYSWTNRNGRQQNLSWIVAMAHKMWRSPTTGIAYDLSNSVFSPLRNNKNLQVRALMPGAYQTIGLTSRGTTFDHGQNIIIALCDVKSQWVGRTDNLREELLSKKAINYHILIVKLLDDDIKVSSAAYNKWLQECELEGTPTFKLSDYEGKSIRGPAASPKTRNKKTVKKVFKLKADTFVSHVSAPSDNYETYTADLKNGSGIWMEIYTFRPVLSTNAILKEQLSNLRAIGIDLSKTDIIAVKTKEKEKVGKKWTLFEDWYESKLSQFVKNSPDIDKLLKLQAVKQSVNERARYNYRNRANSLVNIGGLPKTHTLVKFFNEVWETLDASGQADINEQKRQKIIYNAISALPDDKRPKSSYNLYEKRTAIVELYPMLQHSQVFQIGYWGDGYYKSNPATAGAMPKDEATKVAEYIQLVDKSKEK